MKSWKVRFQHQSTQIQITDFSRSVSKSDHAGTRILWLVDARVAKLHPKRVKRILSLGQSLSEPISIKVSESIKSVAQFESLCTIASTRGLNRHDAVGVIGGGALSDLGGFLAATWMRGISWIVVPTTLLSMVDASIGGKTGINLKAGKNLVGSIWQPIAILIDPGFIQTLPDTEWRSGMGEVVKYAGLLGGSFLKELRAMDDLDIHAERGNWISLIEKCVRYKLKIVKADEREGATRMYLNLGHTFGHAIESSLGYKRLSHGEAVLIGMLAANRLAVQLNLTTPAKLRSFDALVMRQSSGIRLPKLDVPKVLQQMRSDKKRGLSGLRFVLLESPGKPILAENVPENLIQKSLIQAQHDFQTKATLTT